MRLVRNSPQPLMVGALSASTIIALFAHAAPPIVQPEPTASPVVRAEEFFWLDKSLAVRLRLVNTSPVPIGYAGFLGGPHIWICTSDGKSWDQAEAVWNGCLTGFGEYWLQPGKTHEFTRLSQSPYRRGKPLVKFGTAVF